MKKEILFSMNSPFREKFHIYGYRFGEGRKSVAVVGAMRGDEVQQQFVCSQIVKRLIALEAEGRIAADHEILVIPSANHFSMNIGKRFWAMDNTDINRMFPGYSQGETTQRIAAALFDVVKDYEIGIQLASYYIPGEFIPHVRISQTAIDYTDKACAFGLPYVYVKKPGPFDTTLLNYNWQIWNTEAYSIYSGTTDVIDKPVAKQAWQSILRFLNKNEIISSPIHSGFVSDILREDRFRQIVTPKPGILYKLKYAGGDIHAGDLLAKILDPFDGSTLSEVRSPVDGTIFFAHNKPLVVQHTIIYNIIQY